MKNLRLILVLFMVSILISIFDVNAKTYSGYFYEQGYQYSKVGVFAKENKKNLDYNGWYIIATKDDNIYYCIEPDTILNGSKANSHTIYSGKSSMVKHSKLTNSKYDKINLLAYYGYGYKDSNYNHKAKKWYGITQVLIWRTMRTDLTWTFKESRYGSTNSSLFKSEVKELNELVNNHNKKASFSGSSKKVSLGESITLTDTNKVLENYTISSSNNNITVSKSGNSLKIKGVKNGKSVITFSKKSKVNTNYELFYSKTYQDLVKKGSIPEVSFIMNVEVGSNSINLLKEDSETGKAREGLSLNGAEYEVLDSSNKKVGTIITDKDGKGSLEVSNGTYTIKEKLAPLGYEKSDKIYSVTIDNKDVEIKVDDDVIKGNLIINKEKGTKKDGYVKEEGAEFYIYDSSNKKVGSIVTLKDGKGKIELVYGKYLVRQVKGNDGYIMVPDFNVNIDKKGDFVYDLKDEKKSKLIFTKLDFSTSKAVPDTLIEIYNSNDELVFKGRTDKNGKIEVENLDIGKYYILEKDAPKYYVLNKEKMPFEVKENGEVIKCNMENHRKEGKIKIIKKDDMEDVFLNGAKFDIYFEEDNRKVFDGETLNNGTLITDKLIAGKYCIYEVKAPKGYKKDKKRHCVDILEEGKTIEIIIKNKKNLLIPDTFLIDNKNKLLVFSIISILGVIFIIYETKKKTQKKI